MINFKQALNIILETTEVLQPQDVNILSALDYVLAEDIYSNTDIPHFDNSAIDGYAVIAEDTKGATKDNPKILEIIEELPAGYLPTKELKNTTAIKIMTGAIIPKNADAVIMVEDTEILATDPKKVKVFKEVSKGENIRLKGENVKKGELVISKGQILNPGKISMLASLNIQKVKVYRRPTVGILVTGDELVELDEELSEGKVRNSNTYGLYAQVTKYGGIPINLGIARDNIIELRDKIKSAIYSVPSTINHQLSTINYKLSTSYDILLISAGISVGEYDFVKNVLSELSGEIKFWQIAQKPGKPLAFGKINNTLIFGLPGNPVSSMVCFEMYVRPCLLKMQGKNFEPQQVTATIKEKITKKKGLRYFVRVKLNRTENGYEAITTGPQGSGILKSMVLADGLLILPEDVEVANPGDKFLVQLFQ
ncbi:MAG: gephyrin-like molybdotransferase Glp [Endomicrobiia bacterium]